MKPVRLQLSRARDFNLQRLSRAMNGLDAVVVGRPSPWGNPYVIGEKVDRNQVKKWGWHFKGFDYVTVDAADAVRRFRHCLVFDEAIHDHVKAKLGGKNLACWCKAGEPCHADVLLEIANR